MFCFDVGKQALVIRKTIEQTELCVTLQQRLVLVLAMHIHQSFGQIAHLRERHRGAVDERLGAATGIEHTTKQQHVLVVIGQIVVAQPVAGVFSLCEVELGGDLRTRLADTHDIGFCPAPQRKRQGVDHDRFSGTGLARERGEAQLEIKLQRIDNHKIADNQRAQHYGSRSFQCSLDLSIEK